MTNHTKNLIITHAKTATANNTVPVYLEDETGRKVCALWGKDRERMANANLWSHASQMRDMLDEILKSEFTGTNGFVGMGKEISKLIARADGNLFWTYELDGELFDGEFETRAKADEYAQERYAESLEDEPMRNGDTFERDDYALIEFSYDEEGERVIHEREDAVLEYEHYHGDLKEHGYP